MRSKITHTKIVLWVVELALCLLLLEARLQVASLRMFELGVDQVLHIEMVKSNVLHICFGSNEEGCWLL
jgi:hypothetical protein